MLLCCSDSTLAREGVLAEIDIADKVSKEIGDPKFIMPLRLERYRGVFGIASLQYVDFSNGWAEGLARLLKDLKSQKVPVHSTSRPQAHWAQYLRRKEVVVEKAP